MQTMSAVQLAPPSQVFVPVTARGLFVVDNGGDEICYCHTPHLAAKIADLLNADAGVAKPPGAR